MQTARQMFLQKKYLILKNFKSNEYYLLYIYDFFCEPVPKKVLDIL